MVKTLSQTLQIRGADLFGRACPESSEGSAAFCCCRGKNRGPCRTGATSLPKQETLFLLPGEKVAEGRGRTYVRRRVSTPVDNADFGPQADEGLLKPARLPVGPGRSPAGVTWNGIAHQAFIIDATSKNILGPPAYSLFPTPCSLFPVPYFLFPIPCFVVRLPGNGQLAAD